MPLCSTLFFFMCMSLPKRWLLLHMLLHLTPNKALKQVIIPHMLAGWQICGL